MAILFKNQEEMNNTWKSNSPPSFARFGHEVQEVLALDFVSDDSVLQLSTVTKSDDSFQSTVYFNPLRSDAYLTGRFNFNENSYLLANFNTASNMLYADINLRKRFGKSSEAGAWFSVPYKTCTRLFASSLQRHSTVNVVADRYPSPNVTLEASLGTKNLALSGRFNYVKRSNSLRPMEIGIEASNPSFTATAFIDPMAETVRSSCVHHVNKDKKLSAGLEICHFLRTNQNWLMAGGAWRLDGTSTVLKASVDDNKIVKAYACHQVKDRKCWVEICGTYDINFPYRRPKIYLSLEIVP